MARLEDSHLKTAWHRILPAPRFFILVFILSLIAPIDEAEAQGFFLRGDDGDPALSCTDGTCTLDGDLVVSGSGDFGSLEASEGSFDELEVGELTVAVSIWLPECPPGYVRNTTCASCDQIVLCERGRDQMVKVGNLWVDRYQASVWADEGCTVGIEEGIPYGAEEGDPDYPEEFRDSGQVTDEADLLYACSVVGVTPSRHITWFQAQAACVASGKHLITNADWQATVMGTFDPPSPPREGECRIFAVDSPRATGLGTSCVSLWGAEDVIGNLMEWTSDWWQAGRGWDSGMRDGENAHSWPEDFGDGEDETWNLNGRAHTHGVMENGLPAAVSRGGHYGYREEAGAFALSVDYAPSYSGGAWGFRCARAL